MKLFLSSLALIGSVAALAADPVSLKFDACGSPNRFETICIASSPSGNSYIVSKKANRRYSFFHLAKVQLEPTRIKYMRTFTAPVVYPQATGYVERVLRLVVTAENPAATEFRAELTLDGRATGVGYDNFKMTARQSLDNE